MGGATAEALTKEPMVMTGQVTKIGTVPSHVNMLSYATFSLSTSISSKGLPIASG